MSKSVFKVRWDVDILASTPREAALKALEMQRDPESTALVFDVGVESERIQIDLAEENDEGKDICYDCGKVQEYRTMKDVNEADFAIYCDDCYPKAKALADLKELADIVETNGDVDWESQSPVPEFNLIAKHLKNIHKDLVGMKYCCIFVSSNKV